MNDGIAVLFRTYMSAEEPNLDCEIWQAARATSALPTFFKPMKIGTHTMGRNNPTELLLQEAQKVFPNTTIACVLSLGTGKSETITLPTRTSLFQRIIATDMAHVPRRIATDCEETHERVAAHFKHNPNVKFPV